MPCFFYVSACEERRGSILGAPSIFSCQQVWREACLVYFDSGEALQIVWAVGMSLCLCALHLSLSSYE